MPNLPPDPAQVVAQELDWLTEARQFAELSAQENGLKCIEKGTLAHHLRRILKEYDALTTFAPAQVREARRQVWEAMTPYLHHLNGCGCHANCAGEQDHVCNCGLTDHRRAQEGADE